MTFTFVSLALPTEKAVLMIPSSLTTFPGKFTFLNVAVASEFINDLYVRETVVDY